MHTVTVFVIHFFGNLFNGCDVCFDIFSMNSYGLDLYVNGHDHYLEHISSVNR